MRTFVSIDIPEEARYKIKKIQDALPDFFGKKTEPENLHLTLKFLGEVEEYKIKELKGRLKEVRFERFETEAKYLGFFDHIKHGKRYGPVWLYLDNCEGLQKLVDDNLKDFFKPEKRFMSHLTIARIKSVKNKKLFLEKLKEIKFSEIKFNVDCFKLKKSTLTKEKAVWQKFVDGKFLHSKQKVSPYGVVFEKDVVSKTTYDVLEEYRSSDF